MRRLTMEEQLSTAQAKEIRDLHQSISSIYAASLSEAPWLKVLEVLLRRCQAQKVTAVFLRGGRVKRRIVMDGGTTPAVTVSPEPHDEQDALRDAFDGEVVICDPSREGLADDGRNPHPSVIGVNVELDDEITRLRLYRPGASAFSAADCGQLEILALHISQAMTIARHVSNLDHRQAFHEMALDRIKAGLILVADDDRIVWCNQTAKKLAENNDVIAIVDNKIRCLNRLDGDKMSFLIRSARETPHKTFAANFLRSQCETDMSVMVIANPRHDSARDGDRPEVGVFLWDLAQRATLDPKVLEGLFGLTNTEVRLATCLSQGNSVAEAAVELGIKASTVRVHLRSVYEKLGVHRQAELIRRILV
jgi:DNA-binding CsgD family transcriptional regulator